ncbi:MAG: DUF1552 domain-containing protein [Bdellovibrionaceae bacterium]|nr:DUF1552 domain-containing protein [Pseudobdellovibrionaceae bacterium]
MSGRHMSRRTVIRGLGTALSLPLLDAMIPLSSALAQGVVASPRLVFLYKPNGEARGTWNYSGSGSLPSVLSPLQNLKSDFTLIHGLRNRASEIYADGHAPRLSCWLSGGPLPATDRWETTINVGRTLDHRVADHLGGQVMYLVGPNDHPTDNKFNGAYFSNLSWTGPSPAPRIRGPRALFNEIYGSGSAPESAQLAARQKKYKNSILDYAQDSTSALMSKLGKSDQAKLNEYLESVREAEKRVNSEPVVACTTGAGQPSNPTDFYAYTDLMLELLAQAMICGKNQVTSYLLDCEVSFGAEGHHGYSHQESAADKAKFLDINQKYVTRLQKFLARLKAQNEGGASVLSKSIVVYGCGIGDGRDHSTDNLPMIVAGGGAGKLRPGRVITAQDSSLNNLMYTIARKMGLTISKFGTDGNQTIDI